MEKYALAQNNWGLTLFLRQGLAAWMHAWPRETAAPEKSAPRQYVNSPVVFSEREPSLQTQIALLWADIILNRPREIMI